MDQILLHRSQKEPTNPANIFISDFYHPKLWDSTFFLFKATPFVTLCYGSSRQLIMHMVLGEEHLGSCDIFGLPWGLDFLSGLCVLSSLCICCYCVRSRHVPSTCMIHILSIHLASMQCPWSHFPAPVLSASWKHLAVSLYHSGVPRNLWECPGPFLSHFRSIACWLRSSFERL